jgi:ferredoxin-fold anticodon binding domain-containing protein
MRYDKLGNALLHKLGKNASFAEVYLTAVELGIGIESKGPGEVVLTRKTGEDRLGWPEYETRWIAPEEVADWMNKRMVEEGIIKEEEPEV